MDNILEVKHLKKYFNASGGQLHAVDDVSFTIERGKTLGVVGESGCGKSTLGRTIIHLYEPTSGEILFNGKDISHVNRSEVKTLREDIQMPGSVCFSESQNVGWSADCGAAFNL